VVAVARQGNSALLLARKDRPCVHTPPIASAVGCRLSSGVAFAFSGMWPGENYRLCGCSESLLHP
jgi:hypothetical protein